jgi:hypothetical protein
MAPWENEKAPVCTEASPAAGVHPARGCMGEIPPHRCGWGAISGEAVAKADELGLSLKRLSRGTRTDC